MIYYNRERRRENIMNLGMRAHDLQAETIEQLSRKCQLNDIHSIQLALAKTVKDFKYGQFSPAYARKIKKELEENDVSVAVLGCYIDPSNPDKEALNTDLLKFIEQLKYAKFIGADMVGTETGLVRMADREESYKYLLDNLRVLVSQAEKLGVMIGIEGVHCFVINTPEMMRRLMDDLDSPNVCVIFDPINYLNDNNYTEEKAMIKKVFDLLGDKLGAIHLKDYTVVDGKLKDTKIGTGQFDFEYLISMAELYKPQIPFLLEGVAESDLTEVKSFIKSFDK